MADNLSFSALMACMRTLAAWSSICITLCYEVRILKQERSRGRAARYSLKSDISGSTQSKQPEHMHTRGKMCNMSIVHVPHLQRARCVGRIQRPSCLCRCANAEPPRSPLVLRGPCDLP
jgi:hypothetical protein